ncbi:MAG: hypothetical protein REI96_22090 [Flavobacterium nitrogenifigens]|uniref:hypothetical protein n=1 Tax=Flavobacterium nitrogenifigens TaxID=1617283 RepID=UPI002808E69A|nr:hypothetical protein [Flavobacterium nitrogenifigens]MDQ8015153.1 hypothetical protein [Flavobacterium nitrogenifigens]
MTLQDWANIGNIVAGVSAAGAIFIAWDQLNNLNKSLTASNLMTIFEIEFELNRRKERLSEIRKENEQLLLKIKNSGITPTQNEKEIIKSLDGHRKEAYENYLNVFDRLCYFVLQKKLNEDDFRLEYRDMLSKTIQDDNENTFATGTKFRNMVKLYNQWKDK